MNRRNFLRNILPLGVIGAIATPELLELLKPKRTIFLPPRLTFWANAGIPAYFETFFDPNVIASFNAPGLNRWVRVYGNWPVDKITYLSDESEVRDA
jgi:hypothetical protein